MRMVGYPTRTRRVDPQTCEAYPRTAVTKTHLMSRSNKLIKKLQPSPYPPNHSTHILLPPPLLKPPRKPGSSKNPLSTASLTAGNTARAKLLFLARIYSNVIPSYSPINSCVFSKYCLIALVQPCITYERRQSTRQESEGKRVKLEMNSVRFAVLLGLLLLFLGGSSWSMSLLLLLLLFLSWWT